MKHLKKAFFITAILLFTIGCSTLSTTQKKANAAQVETWLEKKELLITLQSANPRYDRSIQQLADADILAPGNTANNINLSSSNSFIKIENDSLSGNLPYYGVRQTVGSYGDNGTIAFNDLPKNYTEKYDEEKFTHHIDFEIKQKETNEIYEIHIQIYPNQKAKVTVNSSQRAGIGYDGFVKPNPKE